MNTKKGCRYWYIQLVNQNARHSVQTPKISGLLKESESCKLLPLTTTVLAGSVFALPVSVKLCLMSSGL